MGEYINLISTIHNSMLDGFFPKGWDLAKIDACLQQSPQGILQPQNFWNRDFSPVMCNTIEDFEVMMGHEIAKEIKNAKEQDRKLILILPVGPMGMYRWAVFFLKEWNIDCSHVYGFNMDEWSDEKGNTLDESNPAAFRNAMQSAFYGPLGDLTVPASQRNYATRDNLPLYEEKIGELKDRGARLVTVYGIGRVFHIAFWEPHFAAEYSSVSEWKEQTHRLGAKLHPLTIEQNAITSFKSRYTFVPATANTIGPALFLNSDRAIGGCDGIFGRGMQWQGVSLWVTLRYGTDMWIPSSFMPTIPGRLFFIKDLAGPLIAECN